MKIDRFAPPDGRHDPSEPHLGAQRVERGVAKGGQELGRPLGDRYLELVQRARVVAQGRVEDGQAVGEGIAARTIEVRDRAADEGLGDLGGRAQAELPDLGLRDADEAMTRSASTAAASRSPSCR